jgi:hypothetical protein
MKKILMLLAVAMLMFGITGQAMAYFEDTHLIRVVYSSASDAPNEFGTDLRREPSDFFIAPKTMYLGPTLVYDMFNFNLTSFGGTSTTWNNVHVAYFAKQDAGINAWTSGPTTGQSSGSGQWTQFQSQYNNVRSAYRTTDGTPGDGQVTLAKSNANSYFNKMDGGSVSSAGKMAGLLELTGRTGDINLAAFADPAVNFVTQFLYFYDSPNAANAGAPVAMIRTFRDGHTEISPVPIPGAVFLLGSGLLGLIGIRRRMMA